MKKAAVSLIMASTLIIQPALQSVTWAQTNEINYCSAIAQNQAEQVLILKEIKRKFEKSSTLREVDRKIWAGAGAVMTVDSAISALQDPSLANLLDVAFNAFYTYFNIKQSRVEKETGKNRKLTLDELIANRTALGVRASSSKACSQEMYAISLADLLNERISLTQAEIVTMKALIDAVEDQRSTGAVVMTGVGLAGLAYFAFKFKTMYFVPLFIGGGISLAMVAGGSYTMVIDHVTLKPVLNDMKAALKTSEVQLAMDQEKLKEIARIIKMAQGS